MNFALTHCKYQYNGEYYDSPSHKETCHIKMPANILAQQRTLIQRWTLPFRGGANKICSASNGAFIVRWQRCLFKKINATKFFLISIQIYSNAIKPFITIRPFEHFSIGILSQIQIILNSRTSRLVKIDCQCCLELLCNGFQLHQIPRINVAKVPRRLFRGLLFYRKCDAYSRPGL